ncbi:MAG: radical SAM protein [Endomicrobiaceae bacterium]
MSNILFVKTFVDSGMGASIPEVDLFISASFLEQKYPDINKYVFFNTGYDLTYEDDFSKCVNDNNIDIILFSTNVWETELLHKLSKFAKQVNTGIHVIVSGQLASIVKDKLLQDTNIDFVIYGESFVTFRELAAALAGKLPFRDIEGICYREKQKTVTNNSRGFYDNVDEFVIVDKIWNLIDIKKYGKNQGWNGINKKKYYIPVTASFGCPFGCSYCTNRMYLGQKFRKRSVKKIVDEIQCLTEKFNIGEIHFFDAVFNFDLKWSKELLKEIIDRDMNLSIAFPHGLRVDRMDEELIDLFKRAGVYKVTYAVETASARLQKQINKNLDLDSAKDIIKLTSEKGIIVCGYFMLGFDNETEDEMMMTISYACNSKFDIASFFKYSHLYESAGKQYSEKAGGFMDFSYFSNNLNSLDSLTVNNFILLAQRMFYLNLRRLMKLFFKSERKWKFLFQTLKAFSIILQGYLLSKIYYGLKKDKTYNG